jgi:hypothetical protein
MARRARTQRGATHRSDHLHLLRRLATEQMHPLRAIEITDTPPPPTGMTT